MENLNFKAAFLNNEAYLIWCGVAFWGHTVAEEG